eukprot:9003730-Pyramimonas_sp.AAC.1
MSVIELGAGRLRPVRQSFCTWTAWLSWRTSPTGVERSAVSGALRGPLSRSSGISLDQKLHPAPSTTMMMATRGKRLQTGLL